ncbi:hypothetical protein ACLOJK_014538, partial [Asimina triloba]
MKAAQNVFFSSTSSRRFSPTSSPPSPSTARPGLDDPGRPLAAAIARARLRLPPSLPALASACHHRCPHPPPPLPAARCLRRPITTVHPNTFEQSGSFDLMSAAHLVRSAA